MAVCIASALLSLVFSTVSFSQKILDIKADQLQVDPLGRLILLDKDQGNIWCYSNELDLIAYNQINVWGNTLQLDLNDPMKPIVFFPDVNRIRFFDEQVSASTALDLDYFQLFNIQAAGIASLGGFWLFSRDLNKIIRIDQSGRNLFESSDLNFVFGGYPVVEQIKEVDDYLVLIAESGLFYVFDFFGNYQFKIQLEPKGLYHLSEDRFFFLEPSGKLSIVNLAEAGTLYPIKDIEESFYSFSVFGADFYGLNATGVYKLSLLKQESED